MGNHVEICFLTAKYSEEVREAWKECLINVLQNKRPSLICKGEMLEGSDWYTNFWRIHIPHMEKRGPIENSGMCQI